MPLMTSPMPMVPNPHLIVPSSIPSNYTDFAPNNQDDAPRLGSRRVPTGKINQQARPGGPVTDWTDKTMWVAGVDGCRAGWIVVLVNGSDDVRLRLCRTFLEVLDLNDPCPDVIAIDIPIGLLETPCRGGRICDQQARRELGVPRGSSVFTPPLRGFLTARSFSDVSGMSIQAFEILKKVAEVDGLITPALQKRIHEAHPELAFRRLAGHAMRLNKKGTQGRRERERALLEGGIGFDLNREGLRGRLRHFSAQAVSADDLLDAYALASTALKIATGEAICLPADPPLDRKGLRMEIWY